MRSACRLFGMGTTNEWAKDLGTVMIVGPELNHRRGHQRGIDSVPSHGGVGSMSVAQTTLTRVVGVSQADLQKVIEVMDERGGGEGGRGLRAPCVMWNVKWAYLPPNLHVVGIIIEHYINLGVSLIYMQRVKHRYGRNDIRGRLHESHGASRVSWCQPLWGAARRACACNYEPYHDMD